LEQESFFFKELAWFWFFIEHKSTLNLNPLKIVVTSIIFL
jgi:hypothetical protein